MQDTNGMTATHVSAPMEADAGAKGDVVSTHVLVGEDQVEALRELSRRTRVAQSEYLREAVDDLLAKYRAVLETKR